MRPYYLRCTAAPQNRPRSSCRSHRSTGLGYRTEHFLPSRAPSPCPRARRVASSCPSCRTCPSIFGQPEAQRSTRAAHFVGLVQSYYSPDPNWSGRSLEVLDRTVWLDRRHDGRGYANFNLGSSAVLQAPPVLRIIRPATHLSRSLVRYRTAPCGPAVNLANGGPSPETLRRSRVGLDRPR